MKNPLAKKNPGICSVAFMLLMMGVYSLSAQKPLDFYGPSYYKGFDASFVVHNFSLQSNLTALHKLNLQEEGISLGGVFGNNKCLSKFRGGLYNSNSKSPYDINLIEAECLTNLYPFNLVGPHRRHKINFYVTGGINMNVLLFYGNYLNTTQPRNYSLTKQPYLGRVSLLHLSAGAGIEYQLRGVRSFGHFFAEVRQGIPVISWTKQDSFKSTTVSKITFINIGFCYGLRK